MQQRTQTGTSQPRLPSPCMATFCTAPHFLCSTSPASVSSLACLRAARGIFVVNQPRYMNFLWALVRPFMKKKLRERVHFIGTDVAAFHDFIDPEVLPEEFGGTLQVRGGCNAAGCGVLRHFCCMLHVSMCQH
jgi:hypothetical protein